MGEMKFSEEDLKKFTEFLNVVYKYSRFSFSTDEALNYVKLLGHMQSKIRPKIEANILEIRQVIEPKEQLKQE